MRRIFTDLIRADPPDRFNPWSIFWVFIQLLKVDFNLYKKKLLFLNHIILSGMRAAQKPNSVQSEPVATLLAYEKSQAAFAPTA